jgi:DNA-binding NtrC family response regulator
MSRAPRSIAALAAANGGETRNAAAQQPAPPAEEAEEAESGGEDDELQPEVAIAGVGGSRLADIAKAAATKAERTIIEDTLRQVHWNRRRAAEQLGVSYKTLLNKIKECGISRKVG